MLYFDNPSTFTGFKDFLRAKVVISANNPLILGFYLDYHSKEPDWIHFRYEGFFLSIVANAGGLVIEDLNVECPLK